MSPSLLGNFLFSDTVFLLSNIVIYTAFNFQLLLTDSIAQVNETL